MQKHEIEAICEMAEALHAYNRGVMAMLGRVEEATQHELAAGTVELLRAQRDALIPDPPPDSGLFDLPPWPAEAVAIQELLEQAMQRRNAAWLPIQALIDEARAARGAADPLGMGQGV